METLSDNAIQILEDRYLLNDKKGNLIETPEQLFVRVAKHIASCENDPKIWEAKFHGLMSTLKFLPNSPTLMNAGCKKGQLSACFVLPVHDSIESIFNTLKNTALIHQSGGGTGFNFSILRPKNDLVSTLRGTSSGAVSFIKVYDAATEHIKQGGKRRGANMGILNVDHPDIEEFIQSKSNQNSLKNFNISVGIKDTFMRAVIQGKDWKLISPHSKIVIKVVSAKALWQKIVYQAWKTGDPGLIFLDTINKNNPTPALGNIQATNPCGEVPLLDYESCNLGSINISKMVILKGANYKIDWKTLSETIHTAIRFLDNVITVNYYLLPKIELMAKTNRKIGLGVMGWAELLMVLEIPYASEKALKLAKKLMKFIREESYIASEKLAKDRGVFPEWKNSIHAPKTQMRNATCNSIAPTGTISVIADTSYSIEPLFALAFKRVGILGNQTQMEINKLFLNKMKQLNLWNTELKDLVLKTGSIQTFKNIPESIKMLFQTSLEISWEYHLLHQKAFQKFTDNAVSKTINLPENISVETISEIYTTAWKYKLKGITIYRNGSKTHQVLQKCSLNTDKYC